MTGLHREKPPADALLWQQIQQGDKTALGQLAERYYRALFQYGHKLTPANPLIQDCLQDLFLRIWEKRQTLAPVASVKAYLFVALRNNLLRQTTQPDACCADIDALEHLTGSYTSPETDYIQHESDAQREQYLRQSLDRLPKRQREALYLKYYENLSYDEIATAMGLNRQVIANYLQNALHTLRTYWQDAALYLFLLLIRP